MIYVLVEVLVDRVLPHLVFAVCLRSHVGTDLSHKTVHISHPVQEHWGRLVSLLFVSQTRMFASSGEHLSWVDLCICIIKYTWMFKI